MEPPQKEGSLWPEGKPGRLRQDVGWWGKGMAGSPWRRVVAWQHSVACLEEGRSGVQGRGREWLHMGRQHTGLACQP